MDLVDLTDFAVQFRYDLMITPDCLNRPQLVSRVEDVVGFAEALLTATESA